MAIIYINIHIIIFIMVLSYVLHARIHGSGTWSSITGDRPGVAWEVAGDQKLGEFTRFIHQKLGVDNQKWGSSQLTNKDGELIIKDRGFDQIERRNMKVQWGFTRQKTNTAMFFDA